jgi:hypothetical protein
MYPEVLLRAGADMFLEDAYIFARILSIVAAWKILQWR